MSLTSLLKQTVTISRLTTAAGIKSTYQNNGTARTLIQPLSDRAQVENGMAIGTGYHAPFDISTDVRVSDQLVDGDGLKYTVTGLRRRNYGSFPHLTAYLVREPGK